MRGLLTALGAVLTVAGVVPVWTATTDMAFRSSPAAATNAYGPGVGPQRSGLHWGGAYALQNVPGYAYCIDPGAADPVELPDSQWSPVPYPGSTVFSDGEMAALADFANRYQTAGYGGYSIDDTVAAIAQVAYASAHGTTPESSAAPAALVAAVEQWITAYPGPWHISLAMTPPPGSTFEPTTNYTGTITITAANGAGIPGVQFIAPPAGGPSAGQVSNFVWLASTTDAAGQMGFVWNIAAPKTGAGQFSASIGVIFGAAGTAPPTYASAPGTNGQTMLVSGPSEALAAGFDGTVHSSAAATGTLSIEKSVPDAAYYGPGGAVFQVIAPTGAIADTLTTGPTGSTPPSVALAVGATGTPYRVHEIQAPPGYGNAPDQVVTVLPFRNTVVDFSGADEEPVLAAQLGAAKVDAQTNQPLAGATFDFRFDTADDGLYDEDLGRCTTGSSGTCQPPLENAPGGWLPGWYQVTETDAPPVYWLDPATAVQDVYLEPGATDVATVTFGDEVLGSLQLTKTGDDTAYLPVTGAVFEVSGPAPSTSTVGTLTVATGGATNTLTGLVPGTYTVTETTPPEGYSAAPPFNVSVAAGHATTETSVTDPAQPGTIVITKTDAATGDPLAGAIFDTRYDSDDDGVFDVDLGTCTTNGSGTCSPPANDGTGYLPGTYQVTETAAPPGYLLPTPRPVETLSLPAAGTATISFSDHLLVGASFVKIATGNVNPAQLDLAGAIVDVTAGTSFGGTVVAACTTDGAGRCTTQTTLVSGDPYCWKEVVAPPGLAAGASGCFSATNAQGAEPITVVDPGMFVAIHAEKVDAASPTTGVAGATFDLYRVDTGGSVPLPTTPADAAAEPGQTWVARATTDTAGVASFPLQLPGFAYCTVEHSAPPDYVANDAEQCTSVLAGSTRVPANVTTIVTEDAEATVTVSAHKFNAEAPDTGIPDAVYDLYVEGQGPPSGPPTAAPPDAATVPGDRWWARGTTSTGGELHFTVPAGYAWCLKEVSAPADYVLDTGLHCTSVVTTTTPPPDLSVALPETLGLVNLYTHKFNALQPDTTIPGATYELVGQGALPPGWSPPANPFGDPVPAGDWFVGTATTDSDGIASWTVPAGYAWCLHEVIAPQGYELDAGWHCTGVVTTQSPVPAETVALPETPASAPELAFTGGPPLWVLAAGLGLLGLGAALLRAGRRGRSHS